MRAFLYNVVTLSPQSLSDHGIYVSIGVWFCVWVVLLVDVFSAPRSKIWKFFWLIVVSVPVVGGILYSIYSLLVADWAGAIFWKKPPPSHYRSRKPVV